MMKVAIIIVNYNGQKYLPDLLGSIFNSPAKNIAQQVIIVDNNSTDDSVVWLKSHYQSVKILLQKVNSGFAEGNNVGLRYALENNFDFAMLLNQDTIVTPGYLEMLIKKVEADEKIAAGQPRLMLYPEKHLINSLGNVIHYLGFGYTYGHRQKNIKPRLPNNSINYCSGAACLLKLAIIKKVGLFNSDLFMYHEDLDLGWRLALNGFKNVIVPEAMVYHHYEFSRSIKKYYFMERNRFIVILQNYKIGTLLLIFPPLLLMELGLLLISFFNVWWLEKLKVYYYFLQAHHWQEIFKKRRLVQRQRIAKDCQVIKNFSGEIKHQEIDNLLVKLINPLFNLYWQVVKRLIFW